ncbi:MAG: SAM-dependent methyltransferase [Acidimicrobiia bacterium]|nr:SAM-dependent methyltransferase [Acidimicrobiia bacterium]
MAPPLNEILLTRIAEHGPIPFEEFQSASLYDPEHGFFSTGELRSTKAGDFLTSPEVSPLFGETLAAFVEKEWHRVLSTAADGDSVPPASEASVRGEGAAAGGGGRGALFHLVEVGAGSGSLLKPLLDTLTAPIDVWTVEASPMAREALAAVVPPYPRPSGAAVLSPQGGDRVPPDPRPSGAAVLSPQGGDRQPPYPRPSGAAVLSPQGGDRQPPYPRSRVLSSLDELPDHLTGVIIANELLDNLPVAVAVRTEDGWRERWVGADGDQLVLVDAPARPEVVDWCDRFAGPCPVDGFVEVQIAAAQWLAMALGKLDHGALLLIDYGDTAENLEPRRTEGTLRTYRAHHVGPHPLDAPGETDITSDVNFTALQALAADRGADVEYHRQDEFLSSLGLRERLSQLRRRELDLARHGDPLERLKIRSRKNEAETLLNPRGLGDFRVLVARVG